MKTLLFLGFDKDHGLTYHFADWIAGLDRAANNRMKIYFVTVAHEQNSGLHEKIKSLRHVQIEIIDSPDDIRNMKFLEEVDIVHCHGFRQISKILKIKKEYKLKFRIVTTMHSFKHGRWYRPLFTNLVSLFYLRRLDAVQFLSHSAKDEFMRYNLLFKNSVRLVVLPLGCNQEEFSKDVSLENLDFYGELSESRKNIIYLANFSKVKQHIKLINCVADILIKEEAKLWLFGEGTEKKEVQEYVKKRGLSRHVRFTGRVDRRYVPSILKKMDLAVCLSSSETFGHLIAEPLFAGIPVVTCDVGIANYLIRDFTTGFVVKKGAEKRNFGNAVGYLLENSDAASAMGKNGKLFAKQWMTWDVISQSAVDMYSSI